MQSEEYLNALNTEILPLRKHHRVKRTSAASLPLTNTEFCYGTTPSSTISNSNSYYLACRVKLNSCIASNGAVSSTYPCSVTVVSGYTYSGTSSSTFLAGCLDYIVTQYSSSTSGTVCAVLLASTTASSSSDSDSDSLLEDALISGVILFAAAVAISLLTNPTFPLLTERLTPPGNPNPGSLFGGEFPLEPSASTLDLMPHRVIPVTVFPPYATPRTFEAESIIFLEDPELLQFRVRRSIWSRTQNMGSWVFSGFNTLARNFRCLRTRLYAVGHSNDIRGMRKFSYVPQFRNGRKLEVDENVNSIDDCIEGVEEPLYGFRTNITLLRDSPCIMGSTCDIFGSPGLYYI